jgi:D-amino-acid oxidase
MPVEDPVLVVGAGVSGLTAALVLANAGFDVEVVAEEIPGRTSLAAGAMWGPYLVEPKTLVDLWSQRSLEIFRQLASESDTGVSMVSGIEASRHQDEAPGWAQSLPDFEPIHAASLPIGFLSGYRFRVPLIDMPIYLGHLQRRIRAAGVIMVKRRISTFDSLSPSRTVINCAGMGARTLAADAGLRPIRGQHVVVTNPGLTEFF